MTQAAGRKVATPAEVVQPLDWCIEPEVDGTAAFYYRAPDGVLNNGGTNYDHIWIATGEKRSGYWQWDGNTDAPTISPSIFHKGLSDWHGFFEAGNWRTL